MSQRLLIGVLAALAGGVIAFLLLGQSDEARIRATLAQLAERVSNEGQAQQLEIVADARAASRLFSEPFTLELPKDPYNVTERYSVEEIERYIIATRTRHRHVELSFEAITVRIADASNAQAFVSARVLIGTDPPAVDAVEALTVAFRKIDGTWRIARMAATATPA